MNKNSLTSIFLVAIIALAGCLTADAIKKVTTPDQKKNKVSGNNVTKEKSNSGSRSKSTKTYQDDLPSVDGDYRDDPDMYFNEIIDTWDLENYDDFLKRYPSNRHSSDIRQQRNELGLWLRAKKNDTLLSYFNYLDNTQMGYFKYEAEKAIKKLEELEIEQEWLDTQKENTIIAYDRFITDYPNSKFINEAKRERDELKAQADWDKIKKSYNISSYENFIQKYPDFWDIDDVKSLYYVEKGKNAAEKEDFVEAFKYFDKVPNSSYLLDNRYLGIYKKSKEEATFRNLNEKSSQSKLKAFLTDYPNSIYLENVRNYLALNLANSFNSSSTDADYDKALSFASGETLNEVKKLIKENKKYKKQLAKEEKKKSKNKAKADEEENLEIISKQRREMDQLENEINNLNNKLLELEGAPTIYRGE